MTELCMRVRDAIVRAGSTFRADKKEALRCAIASEESERAKWVLQTILDNGAAAEENRSPLCDDSGIPHLMLEIGKGAALSAEMLDEIYAGVRAGLRSLPGRPMGLLGSDRERLAQSAGIDPDSAGVLPAPILLRRKEGEGSRLTVLMFGGGPAIRAKTLRVFHRHNSDVVLDEITGWAKEAVSMLGCGPCTLLIGIGRSHFEAASLMVEAACDGDYAVQSDMEKEITRRLNETGIGPIGLGGKTSVLATFMKVGPHRAAGVRIVCMRPSCCFEPRIATVEF